MGAVDPYVFFLPNIYPYEYLQYYFQRMRALREVMGTRPFWVCAYAGHGEHLYRDPDPTQLRFMAYVPVAAGAKGIVWFEYNGLSIVDQDYVVLGGLPTCKYQWLTPINLYLHQVVGPVVMTCTHKGIFHQSLQPSNEPGLSCSRKTPGPTTSRRCRTWATRLSVRACLIRAVDRRTDTCSS